MRTKFDHLCYVSPSKECQLYEPLHIGACGSVAGRSASALRNGAISRPQNQLV